jgi:hypothetical protein
LSFIVSNNIKIKNEGLVQSSTFQYHIAGDIFEPDIKIENLYHMIKKSEKLPPLVGEFSIVFEDSEEIIVINDELGTIKWFIFIKNKEVIVSNNLWKIAQNKDFSIDNVDKGAIYEYFTMYQSLDQRTIFTDVELIEGGTLVRISKKNMIVSKRKYMDIIYNNSDINNFTKEEIFEEIDIKMENTVEKVIAKYPDSKIGVTISGGLDSRFPLPYLDKIKNTKVGYLIGTHKGVLDAYDFKSAKKMASIFNLKLKFINPFSTDIEEKILIDISRNPLGASNILKAINKKKTFNGDDNFDILFTGAYGGLIGGRVLNKELLNSSNSEILAKHLFFDYSEVKTLHDLEHGYGNYEFLLKSANRIVNLFTGKNIIKQYSREEYLDDFFDSSFLVPKVEKEKIYKKLVAFVNKEKSNDKSNLSIIMKVHLYRHSIRGAFESLHGQVRAYSIYHPYIYEYSKNWPVSYLENRSIMEEFLLYKYPELARVPLQSYDMPINYRFRKVNILLKVFLKSKSLFNFILRGLSIDYNSWWHHNEIQDLVKDSFKRKDSFFNSLFNHTEVKSVMNNKRYTLQAEHLLKLKLMLDFIEKKNYDKLIDLEIEEVEKY